MQTIPNWSTLWRELVERRAAIRSRAHEGPGEDQRDAWRGRARQFQARGRERWQRPDSSRTFILSRCDAQSTLLDIGAGTGAWASLLAPHLRHVTAVEPSPAMIEVLREHLQAAEIANVSVVQGTWPDVQVTPHDLSLCAHAMYMARDLPGFVRAMVAATRRTCFLLMRTPVLDSVMAQAAQRVWGQPHDSPNAIIAYNALLEMGIYANILMEDTPLWGSWRHASLEAALVDLKERLGLVGPSEHDGYLMKLLRAHLREEGGGWVWPPSVRSALVYWDVAP